MNGLEHSRAGDAAGFKQDPHPRGEAGAIGRGDGASAALTPRENEVRSCLARGRLYKETADELGISFSTVHKHQNRIFRKLKLGNRLEAVLRWLAILSPVPQISFALDETLVAWAG
ncbi:MAG: helix-turn-helix transcriptional regulator [Verrucomicrobiota bacterium]|nr:helix-turn-helix transcriptional regulator [Verrucomicrobiota bacterium]